MVRETIQWNGDFKTKKMFQNSRKHNRTANIYHKHNYNTAKQIWGAKVIMVSKGNGNVLMKKKSLHN